MLSVLIMPNLTDLRFSRFYFYFSFCPFQLLPYIIWLV